MYMYTYNTYLLLCYYKSIQINVSVAFTLHLHFLIDIKLLFRLNIVFIIYIY